MYWRDLRALIMNERRGRSVRYVPARRAAESTDKRPKFRPNPPIGPRPDAAHARRTTPRAKIAGLRSGGEQVYGVGVDVNPSALRTFSKNFAEAAAIEGSVRSRTVQAEKHQYGYDVWMSHKGTMPVLPNRSNFENCLAAVEDG